MAIDWQSRRDGFDHRKYKPTDAPINWKYWGSLQGIKQWDACALSLNINPDCLKAKKMAMPGKPEFLDASFPSEAALLEFYDRLTMLNREAQDRYLAPVNPAWFAAWCVRIELADLPPELVAMALQPPPVAPTAPEKYTAKPAPVVTVSDGPAPNKEPKGPKFSMTKAGLIDAHEHEWPTIRGDIAGAASNGLKAAKAGSRGWYEGTAMEWARAKGKLTGKNETTSTLNGAMNRMATLPVRKHTLEG